MTDNTDYRIYRHFKKIEKNKHTKTISLMSRKTYTDFKKHNLKRITKEFPKEYVKYEKLLKSDNFRSKSSLRQ